tara:strand:+ start:379 stop:1005 length:627 start_codon:yes stop_codon:yes gene_type:complete
MHDIFFQNLLKSFFAIDPISLLPIFVVLTSNLNLKETVKLAVLVFVISTSVLTFFSFFGNIFLLFMGVSVFSFQIIGGIFLLFISFEMVFEKRAERKKKLSMDVIDENSIKNIAIFPMSIPLIVGPSAMTLSVLISKDLSLDFESIYTNIIPMILIVLISCLMIFFSNYILKILSETFIKVLQKIFGIILGALSVEFVVLGIKGLFWV